MAHEFLSGEYKITENASGYFEVSPKPSEDFLSEYYESLYYQDTHGSYSNKYTEDELKRIEFSNSILLRAVESCIEGSECLDVGCGEGFLLNQLKAQGCHVTGLDFSDYGLSVHNTTVLSNFVKGNIYKSVQNLIVKKSQFDVIFINNVLEHVLEPESLILSLSKILKINGKLVIRVPNDFSDFQLQMKSQKMFIREYWVNLPDHLNYFNKESLTMLVTKFGLQPIKHLADFPIEFFITNDKSNYVKDSTLGPFAHMSRIFIENYINSFENKDSVVNFWSSMAEIGLGRNVISIFTKVK